MKIDIETMFFIRLLKLKEAKIKKYSSVESKYNVVYLFDNEEDYKYYFIDNGFDDVSKTILNAAIMKTTKKGTIIALKGLCDYAIIVPFFVVFIIAAFNIVLLTSSNPLSIK